MTHKKATARANAGEKAAAENHLAELPAMPSSQKQISQGRFPGETPLTGEDRPIDRARGKQEGADLEAPKEHAAAGTHPRIRSQGMSTMPREGSKGRRPQKPRG
jgi:hypothetical protein